MLAAHGAYSWQNEAAQTIDTNLKATVLLLDACAQVGQAAFVNAGSSSEYGFKSHPPAEDDRPDPNSLYAVTKAVATHYACHLGRSRGLRVVTARLYSVFGPYEAPGRLLPTPIVHALRGELPPLVDPDVARDFVYVEDVNDALLALAERTSNYRGEIFNVGTGIQTTVREAVEVARRELGISAAPAWGSMPNRQWDSKTWVADNRKLCRKLSWTPRRSFAEGFHEMVARFHTHPELVARIY